MAVGHDFREPRAYRRKATAASFAGDVLGVLSALDLTDVVLVGHSMGGPVVAETALRAPERVRGVVGADTYQYVGARWLLGRGVPNLIAPLQADFRGTTAGFVRSMFTDASDPALVQRILDQMTAGSPEVGIPATLSMFEWYRDRAVKSLTSIDRPIWTVNSAEYVGTDVERLQELVPGIQVRTLAGVGHFVMLEAPDAFNQVLDQVLARVLDRL